MQILAHLRPPLVTKSEPYKPQLKLGVKSLPNALLERLLGKAPLRLVRERSQIDAHIWSETLECGHEVQAVQNFAWEDGHLVFAPITAKRRRCTKCKAVESISERDLLEAQAAKIWALTVEQNKIRYGSLYDNLFDEHGIRRTNEPMLQAGAVKPLPSPESPDICGAGNQSGPQIVPPSQISRRSLESRSDTTTGPLRNYPDQGGWRDSEPDLTAGETAAQKKPSQSIPRIREEKIS